MRTRARAAGPAAVDVPYLATAFELPEDEIQTLLDAPTTELVNQFLASITSKAQEYEDVKAEKLRVDVELENTVRTSETKVKAQKAIATKHAKEIEELRTKLNEAEGAREALATELAQLKSSSSTSGAELSTLRLRIESLEASNRDALALVESKSTEKDQLANELSEQHTKLLALRKEVVRLEDHSQSLENAAANHKFREQTLQQEIDLLKRNNEWHSNELSTRGAEHAKFRKERNARISSLQRDLEESSATVEALQRTETTLRQRLEDVQAKADDAFAQNASLKDDFARKEQDFRTQIDNTKRLADLQAQNASTHKARLNQERRRGRNRQPAS
jgi:nucleoprotein TPR